MNTKGRYAFILLAFLLCVHWIVSYTHEGYGEATSYSNLAYHLMVPKGPKPEQVFRNWHNGSTSVGRKANATFVILARNSDLEDLVESIEDIEDQFNRRFKYPYVFLNEIPFTEEFKERMTSLVSSKIEFGVIPYEHWYQPDWIDEKKANASRHAMAEKGIIYAGSVPYRNMCRFNSGFFFKHPLMLKYRWYWRIEPKVRFHCGIDFDPFLFMEDHGKVYGFTIALKELVDTIPTLWNHVQKFMRMHPEYIAPNNAKKFLMTTWGEYNLCHFWSNFEIADMKFWRGPAYTAFFEYLDSTGGFYYERWGDAPIHSIAAALFANKDQIHFFDDIGYQHDKFTHCPRREHVRRKGKCACDPAANQGYNSGSCTSVWDKLVGFDDYSMYS